MRMPTTESALTVSSSKRGFCVSAGAASTTVPGAVDGCGSPGGFETGGGGGRGGASTTGSSDGIGVDLAGPAAGAAAGLVVRCFGAAGRDVTGVFFATALDFFTGGCDSTTTGDALGVGDAVGSGDTRGLGAGSADTVGDETASLV